MYEEFFEMQNTPFSRDVPADRLYTSPVIDDAIGRLTYAADRQLLPWLQQIRVVENRP